MGAQINALGGRMTKAISTVYDNIANAFKKSKNVQEFGDSIFAASSRGKNGLVSGTIQDIENEAKQNGNLMHIGFDKTNEAGEVIGRQYYHGGKVLGAAFGAAAGARLISGGGIYRDANGNTDIVGVPFV